ncbi:methyltransferase domain-containing protein [Winogradskyella echinorum]|uniref:Methyltransferase domain-containing protein n=1 Tax=Winogradskyella echinorum TaxID=538189 RepID=A0ABR6XWF2_9FLAO|nr:methyltransferase domain-containing protein [Winogradskyella echinorum]MBC3844811.1 methyltransferase domain-containing protein [Winogradskyella echinorum]MBC5749159.1 methyltransferase domain-containing protein [Winogradskyella echinorum]
MNKDIFGKALLDYQSGNYSEDIITWTNISDKDELPLPYLFRDYFEMPKIEQKALQLTKGTILDVGCGAGSHSLYLQQKGFKVKAIDSSKGAIEVAKQRGVLNTELKPLLEETQSFDTILLLMNGTGIFEELAQVSNYLKHLKSLLNPNGQILIDSSDISYMYDEYYSERYFGELNYFISYKGEQEAPMKWLYIDFETLNTACQTVGLKCEKVMDGEHFDYLARIS